MIADPDSPINPELYHGDWQRARPSPAREQGGRTSRRSPECAADPWAFPQIRGSPEDLWKTVGGPDELPQIARVSRRSGKVAADPWTLSQIREVCRRSLESAGDPDDFPQISKKCAANPEKLAQIPGSCGDLRRSTTISRDPEQLSGI